mmetsp:Transcript_29479/g.49776  ORF Transcript_29479/g.49776 Transcript_29479/m.49776 type:complete len:80 (+) Transcript_29479:284-523(+)
MVLNNSCDELETGDPELSLDVDMLRFNSVEEATRGNMSQMQRGAMGRRGLDIVDTWSSSVLLSWSPARQLPVMGPTLIS